MTYSKLLSLIIMFSLTSLFSCHKKNIAVEKMPTKQILFGSGGGFTGVVSEYALLENGSVLELSNDKKSYNVVNRIGRQKAGDCVATIKKLGLETLKFDEPGNLYYYIVVKTDKAVENRITWGSKENPVDNNIKDLYQTLISFLPKGKG
jgi:hypothetical protein